MERLERTESKASIASPTQLQQTRPRLSVPCSILLALAGVGLAATVITMGLGLKQKMSMVPAYMSLVATGIFGLMAASCGYGSREMVRASTPSGSAQSTPIKKKPESPTFNEPADEKSEKDAPLSRLTVDTQPASVGSSPESL